MENEKNQLSQRWGRKHKQVPFPEEVFRVYSFSPAWKRLGTINPCWKRQKGNKWLFGYASYDDNGGVNVLYRSTLTYQFVSIWRRNVQTKNI